MSSKYCQICSGPIDRLTFPTRGNVCFECEVTHGLDIRTSKKGRVIMSSAAKRKDTWYRAIKGSGHYPMTFNFLFIRNDRYIQCSYCGKFTNERKITRDHVYPKSKGGLIKTPACSNCNIVKEDMLPIEWAVYAYENGIDVAILPIGFEEDLEEAA